MPGALPPPAVASLRFTAGEKRMFVAGTAGTARSNQKMFNRNPSKATIRAFTETATATAPAMETRRSASLYDVLRVKPNASPVEIKAAYRSLAKVYHPDSLRSETDGRDFIEIHNAYSTLSDPAAREIYDVSLSGARSGRRSVHFSAGNRSAFYTTTRRWETDQCW